MIDGAGIWLARHPSFRALRQAGGQVALFHPLFGLRQHGPRNLRNHRKFVLADDARLWSGGRNFAVEYFCGDSTGAVPWIDLSFDLTGTIAAEAARQFELDWTHSHGILPERVPDVFPAGVGPLAQFLPSGPDQPEDTAQLLLVAACFRAQQRLLAVTPYFVPDESLLTAMRLAARRGVRVTLVLPAVSNHRLADFARGRALRALAEAGADIRLISRMVHAKAIVMDDELALCGSVNLDARSLLINYESAVVFYGVTEIAWLARWIDALATRGTPFVPRAASLWRDLAEGLLLITAFQL
jgi:cardiolipin synthase